MVVDGDSSDPIDCISWHHMIIVFEAPISLSRSGTIGQDEVEPSALTIPLVVLKADECEKHSTFNHFIDLSLTWKFKHSFIVRPNAYYL